MDQIKYRENEGNPQKITQVLLEELERDLMAILREGGSRLVEKCKKHLQEVIENAVETEG